jgi:hypothetical protein
VQNIAAGWIAGVASLLVFSTLLSPQFLVWLLPAAAIAWADRDHLLAVATLLVAVLTRAEFGGVLGIGGFDDVLGDRPAGVILLSLRNASLVGLLVLALVRLARAHRLERDRASTK